MNLTLKKRLKLFQIACVLFLLLCLSSCRAEISQELNYSRTWTYAQSRKLGFQCVINSAEEIDANVINTVLTQISGSAALEYRKDTCTFAIQEIKVKIGAGEVEFSYDSSQTYTDERDILRNTPFSVLLNQKFALQFDENGRISEMEGYDAVTEALDRQAGYSETGYQIKRTFYDYFSEDTLKFLMERITAQIPFREIASDSEIIAESTNILPYGCDFSTVFQYNGAAGSSHDFDLSGSVSAKHEYTGILFDLTGETTGKMKIYESSGSGSPFREGYEQSNLKGTETYESDGQTVTRNLSLTFSLQYNILNN